MRSQTSLRCIRIGVALSILLLGVGLVSAQTTATHRDYQCANLFSSPQFESPDGAYPLDCIVDDAEPIGQGFPPLQQLLDALSRLLPVPPMHTPPLGGLEFSPSGESAESSGVIRKPEQVRLEPVPRPREP